MPGDRIVIRRTPALGARHPNAGLLRARAALVRVPSTLFIVLAFANERIGRPTGGHTCAAIGQPVRGARHFLPIYGQKMPLNLLKNNDNIQPEKLGRSVQGLEAV
jgi:hypothetical protein